MSGSSGKECHDSSGEILIRSVLGKQLGKGSALKRCQDIGHHAYGTENLGDINTVHDRSQHSDLVCLGTVNVLTGTSSPEIATTDNDTYLNTVIFTCNATFLTVSSSKPVFFSPASASPLSFSNILFMVICSLFYFLFLGLVIIEEGSRADIRIALRAHTFDYGTVVDLYGLGLDVAHYDGGRIQHYRSLYINIALYRTCNSCADGSDVADDYRTCTDFYRTFADDLTVDLGSLCKDLGSLGISIDISGNIQFAQNINISVDRTSPVITIPAVITAVSSDAIFASILFSAPLLFSVFSCFRTLSTVISF